MELRSVELVIDVWNNELDFGTMEAYRMAEEDAYGIVLFWRHGRNHYHVRGKITRQEIINGNPLWQVTENLVRLRDAKVEQVKYWTNCMDIE